MSRKRNSKCDQDQDTSPTFLEDKNDNTDLSLPKDHPSRKKVKKNSFDFGWVANCHRCGKEGKYMPPSVAGKVSRRYAFQHSNADGRYCGYFKVNPRPAETNSSKFSSLECDQTLTSSFCSVDPSCNEKNSETPQNCSSMDALGVIACVELESMHSSIETVETVAPPINVIDNNENLYRTLEYIHISLRNIEAARSQLISKMTMPTIASMMDTLALYQQAAYLESQKQFLLDLSEKLRDYLSDINNMSKN